MATRSWCLSAVLVVLVGAASAAAQVEPDALAAGPVNLKVCGTADLSAFAGFAGDRRLAPRGMLDLTATIDLGQLAHWHGASFVAQYYAFGGRNGSAILGDYQGYSNIDADPFAHTGELSLDVEWIPERLRTRVGRLDANSDFALPISTELFQHSSAGFSGAIFPMPTYPNPEVGAVFEYHPAGTLSVTGGVYNGPEPEDAGDRMLAPGRMWMAQVSTGDDPEQGRIVVGTWRHTGLFLSDTRGPSPSVGWYVVAEQVVGHVSTGREVVASMQASFDANDVAPVRRHLAAGIRVERVTHRRFRDAMGMRVSLATVPDPGTPALDGNERGLEVFHRFALNPWLSMQPDLQYVNLPKGTPQRHRLAMTLRLHIER